MPEKRVVSLIASATEIVCALDCADQLVGVSHECDYPGDIVNLPRCTEPKFAVDGLSCEIDSRIKSILRDGLSVYRVFPEILDELKPDLVITQAQCEVCAVSLRDVEEALQSTIDSQPEVLSLEPHNLEDIWESITQVGAALGVPDRAEALLHNLKERIGAIARDANAISEKPTVACVEWIDPLMTAGNWMPELVKMAGGLNLFGEPGAHSPWLNWEDFVNADPDVILVFPCGWDKDKAREEMHALESKGDWHDLDAVRKKQVYLIDGNHYCNRPGPRLVDTLEILAEIIHPEAFDFDHRDNGWTVY